MSEIYTLDFSEFDTRFRQYCIAAPDDAKEGVREALQELKLDSDNIPPRTPHKEGHLRGSGKVIDLKNVPGEVSGILQYGGKGVEYDVPYAAKWHEAEPGTVEWSEPDVGPKFIESKIVRYMKKYMEIIAEIIRKRRG